MGSNIQDTMQRSQRKRKMAAVDPATIVTLAREGLHDLPNGQKQDETYDAIEEVVDRFDQLQRALSPAGAWTGTGQPPTFSS